MKKLIGAVLALAVAISPAIASVTEFYHVDSGQWSIEGYYGDKNFCSAKTYWTNGSYVSLFNMMGSDQFSLYVHNKDWNMRGDFGKYYSGQITFDGKAGYDYGDMDFQLKDSKTIIIRNLTDEFLNNWIKFRYMTIIMPNDIENLDIELSGTAAAVDAFAECIDYLNATDE